MNVSLTMFVRSSNCLYDYHTWLYYCPPYDSV